GGDGVLIARGAGDFRLTHPERVRFLGVRVPRRALAPLVGCVEDAAMRRIPRDVGKLRLLTTYLGAVADQRMLAAQEQRRVIVRPVHELIALTVRPRGPVERFAARACLRAARLHAIQVDIVANLEDPDLDLVSVAARHGITPRYIHKLFEPAGVTF